MPNHRDVGRFRMPRTPRPILALVALLALLAGVSLHPSPSLAVPVSDLSARWYGTTPGTPGNTANPTITNGTLAKMMVSTNANDSMGAHGVWRDFSYTATVTNAAWSGIPRECVQAKSSISPDGHTMTCNMGDVDYGTAIAMTAAVVVSGPNNGKVNVVVTSGTTKATMPELTIAASPGIDVILDTKPDAKYVSSRTANPVVVLPVAVAIPKGSEPLAGSLSFQVKVTDQPGASASANLVPAGCGAVSAASTKVPATSTSSPEPGTCTLTQLSPGLYQVAVTGLRTFGYEASQATTSFSGTALPPDRWYLNSFGLYFNTTGTGTPVLTNYNSFSFQAVASNVAAPTVSGATATDVDAANNTTATTYTIGDQYASYWAPGAGGLATQPSHTPWDGRAYVMPGDSLVAQVFHNGVGSQKPTTPTLLSECVAIDTATTSYDPTNTYDNRFRTQGAPATVQYLTTPIADLSSFVCDDTKAWSATAPADPSLVTAIRVAYDQSQADPNSPDFSRDFTMSVALKVKSGLAPGTQVWEFGSLTIGGKWITASARPAVTTVGGKYDHTTSISDVVLIDDTRTVSSKAAGNPTPASGEVVDFTITGGVNTPNGTTGTAPISLTDVIPVGMSYVPGSASATPASVTANADGTTTIIWNATTALNKTVTITYKAKVESSNLTTFKNTVTVVNKTAGVNPSDLGATSTSSAVVKVDAASKTELLKSVKKPTFGVDESNTWVLDFTNFDSAEQAIVDIVDPLPYSGDPSNSNFVGTYTVDSVTSTAPNVTIFYTAADPTTLSRDPQGPGNGGLGSPSAIWTTTKPATVTGVRIIATRVAPGATITSEIGWTTQQAAATNVYHNFAGAKATGTGLIMLSSDATAMIPEGSAPRIDKRLDPGQTPHRGGTLTYTVTATNVGPGIFHDAVVSDLGGNNIDPASIALSNPSQGTVSGSVWNVGHINPGQVVTVKVTAKVTMDADLTKPTVNTAIIENPSTPRTQAGCVENADVASDTDQCDTVSTIPDSTLRLNKATTTKNLSPGGTMTYKVEVINVGPDTDYDITMNDLGGQGLDPASIVLSSPTKGTVTARTWTIDSLAAGETVSVVVTAKILPSADLTKPIINAAKVESPANPIPATVGQVNTDLASDTDQWDQVSDLENSTLRIDKAIIGTPQAKPGAPVTYTVTVRNVGPDVAKGVVVTDVGGAQLTGVTPASKTIGDMAPGTQQSFTVTATVAASANPTSPITNRVHVTSVRWPGVPTGCVANTGDVTTDTDRCDSVSFSEAPVTVTLHKVAANCTTNCSLAGAQFAVYDVDPAVNKSATPVKTASVSGADTSMLTVTGLVPYKTYWLQETKAPSGYQLLPRAIRFTVDASGIKPVTTDDERLLKPQSAAPLTADIPNTKAHPLPATGGPGMSPWLAVALAAAAMAGCLRFATRRRSPIK